MYKHLVELASTADILRPNIACSGYVLKQGVACSGCDPSSSTYIPNSEVPVDLHWQSEGF
eukprot:7351833-Alexandrium_andersonii.AAC.1